MQLSPYIFFDGTCEAALEFYKTALGGSYEINRYEGSPMAAELPENERHKVMHATFTFGESSFMASDRNAGSATPERNAFALSLSTKDLAAARTAFANLAAGGTVTMPFERTFWGATFGMVVDKFGIEWMVNAFD